MAVKKMGFEGLFYYGTHGTTASNQLTNIRDVSVSVDVSEGDTTTKGDGTAPPIETSRVTSIRFQLDFQMIYKTSDTFLQAMLTAAIAGTPVALRGKDYASGKGPDGDFILSYKHGEPFKGEQTYDFVAKPNDDDRTPQIYV